jgi:very-short-patch-repair endonuclease
MNPQTPNERLTATVNAWKSKLLDLSKRNRALNFKINKVSTVTVIDELPTEIFRLLCKEKKSLKFSPTDAPETKDESEVLEADVLFDEDEATDSSKESENHLPLFAPYRTETLAANFTDDVLQTNSSAENLDKSLRRIEEQARSIVEEQGVNSLFLALGMLHYKESKDSEIVFKAPLILVPVELARRSAREGFTVKMTDEEIIVNPSLIEYLHRNYAIALPEISDEENYDLQDFFGKVNEAIAKQKDWKITNEIYLALFSFQKLVMYKDLEKNFGKVAAHKIFQQIINKQGDTFIGLPGEIRELSLDKYFAPEQCLQVVDADSSQLRAIATVSQNYDLVLEGPPGTGKSQTITNLIAQALSTGKSVLFVAEKMAALEVVYRRLCEVSLGEFCLELHSTKANKRSVMQDLKTTLDASLQSLSTTQTANERLPVVRELLTNYVNAVHQSYGTLNVSPYRAYGDLDKILDAPKMLFQADIFSAAQTDLTDVLREIDDLVAAAEFVGSPAKHPWRETTKTFYSENNLDEIKWTGMQILEKLKAFSVEAEKLESILGLPHLKTLADIETASIVASTLERSPGAPFQVLVSEAWNSAPPQATDLIEKGCKIVELRKRIEQNFTAQIFEQEPSNEISYIEKKSQGVFSFLAFLDSRYRAIKKRWFALRLPSYDASLIEQASEMKFVTEYLHRQSDLKTQEQLGAEFFGALWQGETSDWNALERYIQWVLEFRQIYVRQGLKEQAISTATKNAPDVGFVQTLRQNALEINELLKKFCGLVGWRESHFENAEVERIFTRVEEVANNLSHANRWASFESVRQKLERSFAKEVLDWAWSEQISFADLSVAFRRAFYQKWLTQVVSERAELREFHTLTHEQRVKEFRDLDEKILRQNRSNLVGQMRGRLQANLQQPVIREQMLTLRSQLNRQRGLMPLRLTMKKCLNAVHAIKPCFMMSPQTVAQLLDVETAKFDLILFDEASQLPTEDAVGAIIRGKQLVVVGDPKQLPPTNFFAVASGQVNVEKDEDGLPLFDDSQSILEEVMSSGVPSSRLKWHYRSAHESLITFSNVSFYDSDLYTFPSVETDSYDSGLHFEFVAEGIYEGKGLNIAEARRVADAVVEHAKKNPQVSLGVGTFNMRQQLAIQDELEQRRREDPSIESFFDRSKREPFFVKNLENIQGDERDVIFLSVTYAKAHDGKLRYNFGPLNGENGWRRMNVLVTRSKKLMRVFSSIKAEDINLAATASRGAKLLRDFLMYAEHKRLDSPIVSAINETESPFEREVFEELSKRGLSLIPQVGASGYRIDFGVLDNEARGKFICGIECDGVSYHSSETARDRDRLRQQILEGRGWEIHRVWSTDWFKDRNGQIERLLKLIEQSRERAKRENEQEAERQNFAESEAEQQAREFLGDLNEIEIGNIFENLEQKNYVRPIAEPYQTAQIDIGFSFQTLLDASDQQIAKVLLAIVEQEAPVHVKEVFTRTASVWQTTAGSRIQARIVDVLRLMERAKLIELRGEFVWKLDGEVKIRSRNGTNIPAERIAPEEIRELTLLILCDGHKFNKQSLINEVRTVFGFNRTGTSLQQAIERVIDDLLREGLVGEGSAGIGLRN